MKYDASKVKVFWNGTEIKGAMSFCVIDETCLMPGLVEATTRALKEPKGREEAQTRLAAIVAELERLERGCTRVDCGTTFVEPADRSRRHAVGVEVASDSSRYSVCECGFSWAAPALTMGGCDLPDDEAPVDTARRLLADARRP